MSQTVEAGTEVAFGQTKLALFKGDKQIKVGDSIFPYIDHFEQAGDLKGKTTIISVVPSVDTPVCEEQTHILGEHKQINQKVLKLTISRDLPMAQKRFAKLAKLTNISYWSDFKQADFGKKSGLLIKEKGLLTRAVIVVDQKGVVQYVQIVPRIDRLPDMEKAIKIANRLSNKI